MAVRLWVIRDAALARRTAYRLPYVKYSTGANKATRTAHRALGKPDWTAARMAFGLRKRNDKTQDGANCFIRRDSAISRPNGLFFHIFSAMTEKIWPAERRMRRAESHRAIRRKKATPRCAAAHRGAVCGGICSKRTAGADQAGSAPRM